jgi:perosamine synthetase
MTPLRIPPFRYSIHEADISFVTSEIETLLRSEAYITMGAHGEALASAFSAFCGVQHAVSVASGTAALEIILRALDVGGGEVIVPTNTFGASPVAVMRAGATPVFADAGEDLAVCVRDVERKLTPRVRAVMTVHIGGAISPSIRELAALCETHGIPLVEDAAHAIGAAHDGRHAGQWGVAAAFSLFSTKVATSGEGGLIATNDERIRETAMLLRDHAKQPDGTMETTGYSWRMSELQAILARAQLSRLDDIIDARNRVAATYDERLADVAGVRLLRPASGARHNRYKYVMFLERHAPDVVAAQLLDEFGIALGGTVYRTPCHVQQAFARFANGAFPNADRLAATHICPPVYADMPPADAAYVGDALRTVLES